MEETAKSSNFIHDFIDEDLENGVNTRVQTRFPPEPNGYLHIGHAKAICINFSTAKKYNGICNLRLDDTNPSKEDVEYVDSIKEDIKWLGFEWKNCYYASSYFDFIYECAIKLIKKGKAYVDDLSPDEIREYRGTLTEPGKNSPYRERSVEENLELFKRMTDGEFPNGAKVLRAKIDMASPNLNMRDPIIYRISHTHHHQTGDRWCVYPMYDFAHPLSDAKEKVTYSLCSLEFENHRPLYNWFIDEIGFEEPPRQIEFARLNLNYCVTSKRKCLDLVESGTVSGWDDPRMPTLTGLRARGVPAEALKNFCEAIGVCKANSEIEVTYFEHFIRDYLNLHAERAMAVFEPIKVTITNFPENSEQEDFEINPNDETAGTRKITVSKHIYIDSEDFALVPPPKYFRLKKDGYVRLKNAYIIKCDDVKLREDGSVGELFCSYVPESRSGNDTSGIKVKGVIHWVDADTAVDCEIRKYDYLLKDAAYPGQDFSERMNYDSVHVYRGKAEPYLAEAKDGTTFQLMRKGYFKKITEGGKLVLSEIVSLKDGYKPQK